MFQITLHLQLQNSVNRHKGRHDVHCDVQNDSTKSQFYSLCIVPFLYTEPKISWQLYSVDICIHDVLYFLVLVLLPFRPAGTVHHSWSSPTIWPCPKHPLLWTQRFMIRVWTSEFEQFEPQLYNDCPGDC